MTTNFTLFWLGTSTWLSAIIPNHVQNNSFIISFASTVVGDPRSNQNPALLAFGILFFKWHNVVASRIQEKHPTWTDEEIFQRTRRFVIATMQVRFQAMCGHDWMIGMSIFFNHLITTMYILWYQLPDLLVLSKSIYKMCTCFDYFIKGLVSSIKMYKIALIN